MKKIKIPRSNIKKLRWGVAGCGRFTEHSFLPALSMLTRSRLVSVYSHSLERAKELGNAYDASGLYNDYDKFLESDFDTLFIGSVNSDHYEQVIKAAKAGKHILCEKPLALDSVQAEEMLKVCEENNVLLTINYVHRYHPLVLKTKEIIDKGMLGRLISVSLNFNIDYAPNDNFRFKQELAGGGALRDLGTHMIDLLRFFGGEIDDITGYMDNIVYKSEVEDFAVALMKFRKSGYATMNVSYNAKKAFNRIEVLGYNGSLAIENFVGKKTGSSKLTIDLSGEGRKSFRKRANKVSYLLKDVQRSFLRNSVPMVTGRDGLINLQLMEKLESLCR